MTSTPVSSRAAITLREVRVIGALQRIQDELSSSQMKSALRPFGVSPTEWWDGLNEAINLIVNLRQEASATQNNEKVVLDSLAQAQKMLAVAVFHAKKDPWKELADVMKKMGGELRSVQE